MSTIREGVDRETVEAVASMAGKYKYGWETEIEMDYAPKGVNPDIVRLISDKNGEPRMDDGLAAAGLRALGTDGRADLGDGELSQDRLSGSVLLRPPEEHGGQAQIA